MAVKGEGPEAGLEPPRAARLNACLLGFGAIPIANIRLLVKLCGEVLAPDWALYCRLEQGRLNPLGKWRAPADTKPWERPEGSVCYDVVRRGGQEPLVLRGLAASPYADTDPAVRDGGLKTCVGMPVRCRGRAIGSLCLLYRRDAEPPPEDRRFLAAVAAAAGIEEQRGLAFRQWGQARLEAETRAAQMDALMNAVPALVLIAHDPECRRLTGNRAAHEFLRVPAEADLSACLGAAQAGRELPAELRPLQQAARGREMRDCELEVVFADGAARTILGNAATLRDPAGRPRGAVGAFVDITERRKAEETIRRLAAIVDSSDDAIASMDLDGRVLSWNKGAEKMFGYAGAEMAGRDAGLLFPPGPGDEWPRILARIRRGEVVSHFETRQAKRDGSLIDVSLTVSPIRGEGGAVTGASTIARDITQRKRADQALQESTAFLDAVINAIGDPLFVKDRLHRWVLLNDAYCRFMGYPYDKLLFRSDPDFFPRNQSAVFWAKDEQVFETGRPDTNEELFTDASGQVHTISTVKALYTDRSGNKFIVGAIRDITELKRAEEERRKFSRQIMHAREDEKTKITAVIHDELGSALVGVASALLLADSELARARPRAAARWVKKTRSLVRDLTARIKTVCLDIRPPALEVSGVSGAVRELVARLRGASAIKLTCSIRLADEARLPVHAQMIIYRLAQEALNNVLKHSRARKARLVMDRRGGRLRLKVEDDGRGFTADASARRRGKTHLGLKIMREQAESLGGTLRVESRPGRGTVVLAELPCPARRGRPKGGRCPRSR